TDPASFTVPTPQDATDGTVPTNQAVTAVGAVVDELVAARDGRRRGGRTRRTAHETATAISPAAHVPVDPPDEGPVRVLFVGGLGRSGSTLVDRMLAQMPEATSVGELVHIWERALR